MRKLIAMAAGVAAAALVIAACSDSYDEDASGPAPGALDGDCYANSTCNEALACVVVAGRARCRPAGASSVDASNDTSSETSSGNVTVDAKAPDGSGEDASVLRCTFQPTVSACNDKGKACYASSQSCVALSSSCPNGAWAWECDARKDCGGTRCCLDTSSQAPATTCTIQPLSFVGIDARDARCRKDCGPGEEQLCQTNDDCPLGEVCGPFELTNGAPPSLVGAIVGICVAAAAP